MKKVTVDLGYFPMKCLKLAHEILLCGLTVTSRLNSNKSFQKFLPKR